MTRDAAVYPRLGMLTQEQCGIIHRASLEILRRTGVRVHHDEGLALLRQADAVIVLSNGGEEGDYLVLVVLFDFMEGQGAVFAATPAEE